MDKSIWDTLSGVFWIILFCGLFYLMTIHPMVSGWLKRKTLAEKRKLQVPVVDKSYRFPNNDLEYIVKSFDDKTGVIHGILIVHIPSTDEILPRWKDKRLSKIRIYVKHNSGLYGTLKFDAYHSDPIDLEAWKTIADEVKIANDKAD